MYSCPADNFGTCDQSTLQVTVIDDSNGPFFGVEMTDVNGDGKDDLLVTNNRDDGKGSVFAYEVPEGYVAWLCGGHLFALSLLLCSSILLDRGVVFCVNSRDSIFDPAAWEAPHVLATGYKPPASLQPGKGAPGTATSFHPQVPAPANAKPLIMVSGDDSGVADLLEPADAHNTSDWTYTATRIVNVSDTKVRPCAILFLQPSVLRLISTISIDFPATGVVLRSSTHSHAVLTKPGGTVGTIAVADSDGDGYVEFAVPLYTDSVVKVYTFSPQ